MIEDWQVLKRHYLVGAGASRRGTARVAHKPRRIMWGSRCCEVRPVKCHPRMSGPEGLGVAGEKQTPSPGRSSDATSPLHCHSGDGETPPLVWVASECTPLL